MSASEADRGLPVLDHDLLLRNAGGDRALAAELLALFASQILPGAVGVSDLVDAAEQRAAAHRVRGAALAIGAAELAAVAGAIEEGGDTVELGPALQRLLRRLAEPMA